MKKLVEITIFLTTLLIADQLCYASTNIKLLNLSRTPIDITAFENIRVNIVSGSWAKDGSHFILPSSLSITNAGEGNNIYKQANISFQKNSRLRFFIKPIGTSTQGSDVLTVSYEYPFQVGSLLSVGIQAAGSAPSPLCRVGASYSNNGGSGNNTTIYIFSCHNGTTPNPKQADDPVIHRFSGDW